MLQCLVHLYLDSPSRLVLLTKLVEFHAMPRVGEWVKLANAELGDYFPFRIGEVTHREGSWPEVMLDKLPAQHAALAAFSEVELDEYVASYLVDGWKHISAVPNRTPGD